MGSSDQGEMEKTQRPAAGSR